MTHTSAYVSRRGTPARAGAELDEHPAVVALAEQDKATKRLIEDDRAKLPADHDYRRSV